MAPVMVPVVLVAVVLLGYPDRPERRTRVAAAVADRLVATAVVLAVLALLFFATLQTDPSPSVLVSPQQPRQ